jgi:hypothetical protein
MSSGQANAAIAEDKAHTLNATHETQTIVTPVVIDRAAFNQGQNAQYEPHIEQTDVMDSLVARGPHAVGIPFRKSKRACSTTDNESLVVADASNTLNNFDLGDTRTTHAVVEPNQIIPTLTAKIQGSSGWAPYNETAHILPVVQHQMPGSVAPTYTIDTTGAQAIAIQGTIIGRGETAGPQGTGATEGGPMFTLTKTDIHGVATPMAVRRLTPVEWERLQGFPDNWSQIPWKGKPADQCPDGPRYKCAGNSMAVPVMRWIGEQIACVELSLNNPTNTQAGRSGCIFMTQDGTGSRTLAYSSNWKFTGGVQPILTTTAAAVDMLCYIVKDSTHIIGTMTLDVR